MLVKVRPNRRPHWVKHEIDSLAARQFVAPSVVIIEMVESDPMQLLSGRVWCLASVDARSTLEEKSRIHEHCSQCQATVPQKRKAPGFGKL